MNPTIPTTTRRAVIGTLAAGAAFARTGLVSAQTPSSTPVGSPVGFDARDLALDEVLPLHDEHVDRLRAIGQNTLDLFFAGKDDGFRKLLAPVALKAFANLSSTGILGLFETNRLQFAFPEVSATWDASFTGARKMSGFFHQGSTSPFSLMTREPQQPGHPTGRWDGKLTALGLGFSVEFGGAADTLTATLDVPAQGIEGQPLSDVAFVPQRPVGTSVADRVFLFGPDRNAYAKEYAWGEAAIVVQIQFQRDELISLFTLTPSWPLPEDPAAGYVSDVTYRLPIDGLWFGFWAGDTELANYHVAYPNQRHASDLVIWKDGATFTGDGTRVEDYFAWGQPVIAPASGTVVAIENGLQDMKPGEVTSQMDPATVGDIHPAGNHVIIQTAEAAYVLVAHMQKGSIRVRAGDEVAIGDPIGLAGNSGNTSEPHVHIHLQDKADFFAPDAIGLPLAFSSFEANGNLVERGPLPQGQFIRQLSLP